MILQLITDAVISKGYNGAPAFHTSADGNMLGFKVGCKVFDKKADNETRWININVNAFDDVAQRIQKMNLKEGSHINLFGSFDMKPWINRETGEVKTWPTVRAIAIEYASSVTVRTSAPEEPNHDAEQADYDLLPPEQLPGFTGYAPFGSINTFFRQEEDGSE